MTVVLTLGFISASLLANILVLSVVMGMPPSAIVINDGTMLEVRSSALEDPVDGFLENVIPKWNYPYFWFAWEQTLIVPSPDDPYTLMPLTRTIPFYMTPHYFADFAPIAILLSTYLVLSRYYFKNYSGAIKRSQKRGLVATLSSIGAPSGSAGATTALTSVAAMACCGAFAIETSVTVIGIAISAAGFVLLSRVFLLVMGALLLVGILRTASKISTSCVLPKGLASARH